MQHLPQFPSTTRAGKSIFIESNIAFIRNEIKNDKIIQNIYNNFIKEIVNFKDNIKDNNLKNNDLFDCNYNDLKNSLQKNYQKAINNFKKEILTKINTNYSTKIITNKYDIVVLWKIFLDRLFFSIMQAVVLEEKPNYLLLAIIEDKRQNLNKIWKKVIYDDFVKLRNKI